MQNGGEKDCAIMHRTWASDGFVFLHDPWCFLSVPLSCDEHECE
jgi:hypothetical protein